MNNYSFRKINLQTFLLVLFGGIIIVFWFWLQNARQEEQYPIHPVAIFWIMVLFFLLWAGIALIHTILQLKYSWERAANRRFLIQIILTLTYALICINCTYYIFKNHFTELPPDRNQIILLNIYGLLFLIPVLSLQFGLLFLNKWKKAIVDQEKLEKERVQSELIALKSHLSPHFLFNNLNILSALIQTENQKAQDFLDRFSEVYRYVLKSRERELVELREELHFLEAYIFLLKHRFGEELEFIYNLNPAYEGYLIPPLAIQMVVENVLKHNKLSEKQPLQVNIYTIDSPALVIKNKLQPRPVPARTSSAFGLENIRRRYWVLLQKEIRVEKDENYFLVELPLVIQK